MSASPALSVIVASLMPPAAAAVADAIISEACCPSSRSASRLVPVPSTVINAASISAAV